MEGASNLLELLNIFQDASGQHVNLNKSSIFFSPNTDTSTRQGVCSTLGIGEAGEHSTYLGLPTIMGRNKTVILGFIKEKMRQRIERWEGKYVSKSGKEILLKTVAQLLPCYAMNVFLLPVELCKEMEQLMCKYWWQSSSKDNKGIHWKSWQKMTVHKSKGGMGFRNLRDFNICLLSKQGWRLQSRPESLVSRLFKARYFKKDDFLNAELGNNPSFVWRSVFEAQQVVKLGARRRVGRGESIDVLTDPWLPCDDNPRVTTMHPSLIGAKVSSLMMSDTLTWDSDLVRDLFTERDADLILSITLNSSRYQDTWFWSFEKSGLFLVKSTYRWLQETKDVAANRVTSDFWKKLWKLRVPPKVKDLLWRAASNCLPTKTLLRSKWVDVDSMCPLCPEQRETISHCLIQCSFAKACWSRVNRGLDTSVGSSFASWLDERLKASEGEQRKNIAMTCWALWTVRNDQVWKNKGATVDGVINLAVSFLDQWTRAQDKTKVPVAAFLTDEDGSDKWSKPEGSALKINVDAALFDEAGNFSFACVARDSSGMIVEAITSCRRGTVNPEMAEAIGVVEALSWIKRKKWKSVVIETDSLIVVQSVRSSVAMISYFGTVIVDCKKLLNDLPDVALVFIRRSANSVAHCLARASYCIADRVIRSEDVSPELLDVVLHDCF